MCIFEVERNKILAAPGTEPKKPGEILPSFGEMTVDFPGRRGYNNENTAGKEKPPCSLPPRRKK